MSEVEQPPKRRVDVAGWWRTQPTWTKVLLGLSAVALVGGGILSLAGGQAATTTGTGGPGPGGAAFAPGQPTGSHPPEATGPSASEGVFRLGFSFVAGFCLGTFLRAMAKIASIAFGFWLLMTLVLASFDLVTVNWAGIDEVWDRFWAGANWGDFQKFLTGSLPAAGLAGVGLYAGLRRRR
jgi:uncharacterized membrane protein (Fun14 family)